MKRLNIILITVLFMGIIFGADRILKLQSGNLVNNNISNSEEMIETSKVLKVTSENFSGEVLESDKIVLIDFYATWCSPCKTLSPTIEEIAKERGDIKVVKIDVDEELQISLDYNIISIPTLVVIENGAEKNRVVGIVSKEEIESML